MAGTDSEAAAREAITAKIVQITNSIGTTVGTAAVVDNARAVCMLAEAHAWLVSKGQPHGGSAASKS